MPLFEVCIVKRPTKKEQEDESKLEELVLPPKFLIARSGQAAAVQATVDHAGLFKDVDVSRFDVLVRAFQ
jgi:hypothetical protein